MISRFVQVDFLDGRHFSVTVQSSVILKQYLKGEVWNIYYLNKAHIIF